MGMFINETSSTGVIFNAINNNVTGSIFLTCLFLIILVMLFFMIFRMPVELSAIFVIPMLLVIASYQGDFQAVFGVFMIYLGFMVAKNFFI